MSLAYAILAVCDSPTPRTGHEVTVRLQRALGDAWQVNSGQVYGTLKRQGREGLVLAVNDGTKTRYVTTPAGRAAWHRFLATPLAFEPLRHPLFLKLAFARPEDMDALVSAGDLDRLARAERELRALVTGAPPSTTGGRARWLIAQAHQQVAAVVLGCATEVRRAFQRRAEAS